MERPPHSRSGAALASILAAAPGCSPGALTEATMAEQPTAASAVGDPRCTPEMVAEGASPLIVDWDPSRRSDLEVAMDQGVIVASFDCDGG